MPVSRLWRARWHWGLEVLLFVVLTVVYEAARDLVAPGTAAEIARAFHHAEDVVAAEGFLHLEIESGVQDVTHAVAGGEAVTTWYYTLAHTPGFIAFFALVWFIRRREYAFVRNWFWATHLFAVLAFWLFPLAPPRFLDLGLQDTTRDALTLGGALDWFQPFRNEFAAMPSLHIGYSSFYAIALTWLLRPWGRWRYLVWLMPAWMLWVTTATANHYWLDGVGGLACVLAGLALVHLLSPDDIARPWRFGRTPDMPSEGARRMLTATGAR